MRHSAANSGNSSWQTLAVRTVLASSLCGKHQQWQRARQTLAVVGMLDGALPWRVIAVTAVEVWRTCGGTDVMQHQRGKSLQGTGCMHSGQL